MARIRTIKPEFWTSEQVVECSPVARLLFIGIWNFCDDYGNIPASPKSLKMKVLPADDISLAEMKDMLDDLDRNGLIERYKVDGKDYLSVTGWHHQKVDHPSKKMRYPSPDEADSTPPDDPDKAPKTETESQEKGATRESSRELANPRPVMDRIVQDSINTPPTRARVRSADEVPIPPDFRVTGDMIEFAASRGFIDLELLGRFTAQFIRRNRQTGWVSRDWSGEWKNYLLRQNVREINRHATHQHRRYQSATDRAHAIGAALEQELARELAKEELDDRFVGEV